MIKQIIKIIIVFVLFFVIGILCKRCEKPAKKLMNLDIHNRIKIELMRHQ